MYAYSLLERWLHHLALGPASVRELSFDLECALSLSDNVREQVDSATRAVYVCGLARSGTTLLLQLLDETGDFCSLTYRDMPFVLAPHLWSTVNRIARRNMESIERVHGDGVLISFDSPESFEEVFWRTFSSTATCNQDSYGGQSVSEAVLEKFSKYRRVVVSARSTEPKQQNGVRRYLSKNNNNLLRLEAISSDPSASVLLVYRNPLDTAKSLHRLHLKFCEMTRSDAFTEKYMSWLGHHEFGPGHLPFSFARIYMTPGLDAAYLDYWIDYWTAVYSYVLTQPQLRLKLISHDWMRADPVRMLTAILDFLGVTADPQVLADAVRPQASPHSDVEDFDPALLRRAQNVYAALEASDKNIIKP